MKQVERMMIRVMKISNQSKQSISITPDMSSKIPMFAGKPGEKLDRWLEKLNSVAEHQKWDKKLKLHVAVNHLIGNAESWQEYQGRSLIHWDAWLTKFKETFDRTLTTREWNRKCEERRQREGESVEDFICDKWALIAKCPNDRMPLDEKYEYLFSGMKGNLGTTFHTANLPDFEAVMKLARKLYRDYKDRQGVSRKVDMTKSTKSNDAKEDESKSYEKYNLKIHKSFEKLKCFKCKKFGHLSYDCPDKSKVSGKVSMVQDDDSLEYLADEDQ